MKTLKEELGEIFESINWTFIAHALGKSNSWLYHKINGIDGNRKPSSIKPHEREELASILELLSEKIKDTVSSLRENNMSHV